MISTVPCRLLLAAVALIANAAAVAATKVSVPVGIDHAPWDTLLRRYVDDRGLVDYATWKNTPEDLRALDGYLAAFAPAPASPAEGDAAIAALINAYNAITIRWILDNHPTPSIRETKDAWKGRRWTIGGQTVSLDEIENDNLRPLYGWKVHATIVCAARSCPPLQRTAYTAENLAALTTQAYRDWLSREDLNRFDTSANTVHVSPIFKWYQADFTDDGSLGKVLETYGPDADRAFFQRGDFAIEYLDYHWGLNDQGELGADYSRGLGSLLKSIF